MIAAGLKEDEAGLVERAIAGNGEAFGHLYQRYLDPIYRYVYLRIGDASDAEDITEQVFLKAWEALPGYRPNGNPFVCWLYRIAHNVVVDFHRRHKHETHSEPLDQEEQIDPQPCVLRQVIASEEVAQLAKAISRLPEEQQQVIVLRFVEGMNHSHIARIMEKSEGACRMIQNRALVALYKLLCRTEG